jgi:hydrogenase maturation factor
MSCTTCSDAAFRGRVISIEGMTALVADGDCSAEVAVELVAPVAPGDLLVCHAGVALEKVER